MPSTVFGAIGPFLRQLRRTRGMSQEELAGLVGTDQAAISAYERGRRIPSAEMLNRLVVACGYGLEASDGLGGRVVCPLPRAGWFPDEDAPPPDPADPPPEPSTVDPGASRGERLAVIRSVLDTAVAVLEARAAGS